MKLMIPFTQSPTVPAILDTSTMLMMGMNNGVNEAHHHNPILKALGEDSSDQVM